jgi:hypothetical protein
VTVLFEDYRLVLERRFARLNNPENDAGGSVISWQGHTSKTGQMVGVRRSYHLFLQVWGWAWIYDRIPEKLQRRPRCTQDCSARKEDLCVSVNNLSF